MVSIDTSWDAQEPLLWEFGPEDWRAKTTMCLKLTSEGRSGAIVGFELLSPDRTVIGAGSLKVDWIGENRLLRWIDRLQRDPQRGEAGIEHPGEPRDARPAYDSGLWQNVSALRLFPLASGWLPTRLHVASLEALAEAPRFEVNESDTVIEAGWSEDLHGSFGWQVNADLSRFASGESRIRPPWPFLRMGYLQSAEPGVFTAERRFGIELRDQASILAKASWDNDTRLTMTALADGGREIDLTRDAAPGSDVGRSFRTIGAELGEAKRLDAVRVTLSGIDDRTRNGREIAVSLLWILLRRPTELDALPTRPVVVRLQSSVLPPEGEVRTFERQVRQVPFDEGPESAASIGDPLEDGLPFGFFVSRDELPSLRRRALEGASQVVFERIRAHADHAISSDVVDQNYYGTAYGGGIGHPKGFRGAGMRLFAPEVAVTHLITGEERYAVACRRWILRAARSSPWCGDHGGCVDRPQLGDQLSYWDSITEWHPLGSAGYMDAPFHVADAAFGIVVAYDMLYHCFSEDERQEVEEAFARNGVYLLYSRIHRAREFYLKMNQGVLFCTPLLMMTAFLQRHDPAYAEMHRECIDFLEEFGHGPWNEEGVCGEGPGYGLGTVHEYVEALLPLAACLGKTVREIIPPSLLRVTEYVQHVRSTICKDPPRFLALSDGSDHSWVLGEVLGFYAKFAGDRVAQFFWDEAFAENPPTSLGALFLIGDRIEPSPPELPPLKVYRDQPMAFLRTGWRYGDTLLALNNLRHVTGHGHADRNSIILEYRGEPLVLDPGMLSYEDPGSKEYHDTFCHSTLTFSQRSQVRECTPSETAIREVLHTSGQQCPGLPGAIDWVISDAATVYPEAKLFLRHVLFLRPGVFVLIDEVEPAEAQAMELNFTCLGPLTGDGPQFVSRTRSNQLLVHSQATVPLTATFRDWGTCWPNTPSRRLIRATAQAELRCTFLTALVPMPADQPLPTVEHFADGPGLSLCVRHGTQRATIVVQAEDAGTPQPLGSDARIAVTNEVDGQLVCMAMQDGTFLCAGEDARLEAEGPGLVGSIRREGMWRQHQGC